MRRRQWTWVLSVLVGSLSSSAPANAEAAECMDVTIDIALPGDPLHAYPVHAQWCPGAKKIVHVLMAGATEGSLTYWDFPGFSHKYSYVNFLTSAGYPSLTIERLGMGASGKPPAQLVTMEAHVHVIHQFIERLRAGELTGRPPEKVIGVGRSLSASMLYMLAVLHPEDLDGIVTESFRQHFTPVFTEFLTWLQPAQLEPRLADRPLGYLTTQPGKREAFFTPEGSSDPAVRAQEEALKDTLTLGEVDTFLGGQDPFFPDPSHLGPKWLYSTEVALPVLSLVGQYDFFFCPPEGCDDTDPANPASTEASHFPQALGFTSMVIPQAGHHMNLQRNNRSVTFPAMLEWVKANFEP